MHDITTAEGLHKSKQWLGLLLGAIKDGGIWHIPRSNTVVHINKKDKIATVRSQDAPEVGIEPVFEAIGWTVIYADSKR